MQKSKFLLFIIVTALLSSCASQRMLSYFGKVDNAAADSINQRFVYVSEPTITSGDQLLISISSLDPEAAAPFNLPAATYQGVSDQIVTSPSLQRYKVDKDGNIELPVLGILHVEGLKKSEFIEMLKTKLEPSLKDPIINVSVANFTVTVMGEVKNPGRYSVSNERATILEALAIAGDMTIYGKRHNVLITREKDGKLEFARIDLTKPDLFMSPYYFLQQNDVVYVEPNNARAISSQNVPLYLSMITSLGSMATVIVSVISLTNK